MDLQGISRTRFRARGRGFDHHVRRQAPMISSLRAAGDDDPDVLAVLLVETYYRPAALRAIEHVSWVALTLARRDVRLARLSVGRAQVQLRHWVALGLLDGIRWTPGRWRSVRDPHRSYAACRDYLAERDALGGAPAARVAAVYQGSHGATGRRYARLVTRARGALAVAPAQR